MKDTGHCKNCLFPHSLIVFFIFLPTLNKNDTFSINAALACEIMEGLASSLYPEMRVQQVALPLVLKAEMMHGLKGLPSARFWLKN